MSAEPARPRRPNAGDGDASSDTARAASGRPDSGKREKRAEPDPRAAGATASPEDEGPEPLTTSGTHLAVSHSHHAAENPRGKLLATLSLTALGVVYGDIGTSPLYSIKECFKAEYGLTPTVANVLGLLSLIVWSLVLIVSVKYVVFILRADNRGEGGVLALLALVLQREHRTSDRRRRAILIALGLFGGAFLYGDGIITPAISVLGAVEGLEVIAPGLKHLVVPISFVTIFILFFFQYKGTAKVGGVFGWVMLAWFLSIGALGLGKVIGHPAILSALNPWHAVEFYAAHPQRSFVVLGAVVLVVTGGEALYADMGHFGKKPIRLVWFGLVLPALLLNYFGQGSLVIENPQAIENPFYLLAPRWFLYPLLFIATAAAVVASQALISGAFSLTQQAVQLGYSPRVTIKHTSEQQAGQIYIPEVNKALAVGTLVLVVTFGSAAALGATYGVAVTGTMAITNLLFYVIARHRWNWTPLKAGAFLTLFMAIDLTFFAANLLKVRHGGWVPLAVAALVFTLMTTWKRGREILRDIMQRGSLPMDLFLADVERRKPHRVKGTAVFMTSNTDGAPGVLLHHLKHNKVLHEQVLLLSIISAEVPQIVEASRVTVEPLAYGFYRVGATYGFMETPDVNEIIARCSQHGVRTRPQETSYYLGRERLLPTGGARMARWRKKLFAFMARNAQSATEFFGIPPNRVVELGTQIEF